MTRLSIISFLFVVASLGLAASASAEETAIGTAEVAASAGLSAAETAKAEKFIRTKHNKVRAVLRKPDTPKRAADLTELLGEFLDYRRLTKLSLDEEWDKRSPRERQHFVNLLRQLVERQYQRNMESTLQYKVKWVGTEPIETGVKVKSSARSVKKKRQPPIAIDYSMSPAGHEWKVFDIFTDEVSLVKNYKRQFRRVIREEGWDGLIGRMEKKLHQEEDDLL
ncbi:MAG: ABC transporter substrate-binding protein [Deltaproteobacteria bacterium]|nr:ABC transporter substrate-binding protein [Deltaproteobacteria bacterium]